MPSSNRYLRLTIGSKQVQISDPEQLPISIDYALEDVDNFQNKSAAQALGINVPATLLNDIAANTYRSADIMDLTDGNVFRGSQDFVVDENGNEILIGKAFLKSATHDSRPKDYLFDLYGSNASWVIDLQDATLFDFLQQINFDFTKEGIIASWDYDGTDPLLPYVFAPVRYREPMGGTFLDASNVVQAIDDNMLPVYMKPSLSKYWLLFWGFKKFGYRLSSGFLDSEYFRRQVMPWTWGNFLGSDGTLLDTHKFLAKSERDIYYSTPNGHHTFFWDLKLTTASPGFVNNPGDFSYDAPAAEVSWTYNTPDYGILEAGFHLQIDMDARLNGMASIMIIQVFWYKMGVQQGDPDTIVKIGSINLGTSGGDSDRNIKDIYRKITVEPGETVSAKVWVDSRRSKFDFANVTANVLAFEIEYFSTPLGGKINFQNFIGFKKYKFLDFFRGVIDEFNLSLNTDAVNKIIYVEPTHRYSITDDLTDLNDGYFKDDFLDWNGKEDLSKEWKMTNYADYNRELGFQYKNDSNDGILKLVQDRNINTLAAGKYVLPPRFTKGTTKVENRFFAPTMHYEVDQWKSITGVSPQMVCMIPENIANTSNSASDNTFTPKSCYYKGVVSGVGGWKLDDDTHLDFPFMFAVNYMQGGENDPILSYSDEKISDGSGAYIIGKGLLKRFYWQRLAIMRNGQFYDTWFRLKNVDVSGQLHREYVSYKGHRWELIKISGYKPLQEESTTCLLRRWAPISIDDFNNTFPSVDNVLATNVIILPNPNTDDPTDSYLKDLVYARLVCLPKDIPTI
jgi:hypothetical protein